MSSLSQLIDQVEQELRDTSNDEWSTDELTAHIRRALRAYNRVQPRRTQGTISATEGEREYSLASLSGLMGVLDVWHPWDDQDPQYPPPRPVWSVLYDDTLRLEVADAPTGDGTDDIRVFYTIPHTIDGLDGEDTTTLDDQGEQLIVLGAAAHAASQLARSLIGTVTVTGSTPKQQSEWAACRMEEFEAALEQLRRRAVISEDARTQVYLGASTQPQVW